MTAMRVSAMLPQINPLPCAQSQSASHDGNRDVHGRKRRADVRGHVIPSFGRMFENGVAVRHKARKKPFEIPSHFRIGILLNQE